MSSGIPHRFVPSRGSNTTLLLLHEKGGDENALLPVGSGVLPGAALLSPRGSVADPPGYRFFSPETPDLHSAACDLETFLRDTAVACELDCARVVVLGYADGAGLAAALMLLYPGVLSGAVLLHPELPVIPDSVLPIAGIPVFIQAGENEPQALRENTERLARTLSYAGAQVEVRWTPGGAELTPEDFAAAKQFLRQFA